MPAITVSSVNTTTDEITAVAHGLLTGDRFRLRNVGGALPAATPALAGATDYFAVRTGADTLKISDTNAHALAGTGIFDLTGAGSGTTTVEYGLPYCIPTALAAAGTQIKSANDQGAWNSLVALYDLLTGQAQAIWSTITVAVAVTFNALVTFAAGATAAVNQHFTVSGTGDYKHGDTNSNTSALDGVVLSGTWTTILGASSEPCMLSGNAATLIVKLRTKQGDRIKTVNFKVFGDGAADVTTTVFYTTAAMSSSSIGTATTTNQAASWSTVTIDVTDTTVAAGDLIDVRFVANAANIRIGNIWPGYDRP